MKKGKQKVMEIRNACRRPLAWYRLFGNSDDSWVFVPSLLLFQVPTPLHCLRWYLHTWKVCEHRYLFISLPIHLFIFCSSEYIQSVPKKGRATARCIVPNLVYRNERCNYKLRRWKLKTAAVGEARHLHKGRYAVQSQDKAMNQLYLHISSFQFFFFIS